MIMGAYDTFIIGYWIVVIIAFALSALLFFILRLKSTDKERKRIMTLIFMMFLFMALSRLFHLIALLRHGTIESVGLGNLSLENELIFTTSQIFLYIGLIAIIASFEKKLKVSEKYRYTLLCLIVTSIYFIIRHVYIFNKDNQTIYVTETIASYIMNGIFGIFGLVLSLMYLKISFKASGSVKRKALLIFIGFVFLILSYAIFILEDFLPNTEIVAILSFTFCLCGIPFLILGYY